MNNAVRYIYVHLFSRYFIQMYPKHLIHIMRKNVYKEVYPIDNDLIKIAKAIKVNENDT